MRAFNVGGVPVDQWVPNFIRAVAAGPSNDLASFARDQDQFATSMVGQTPADMIVHGRYVVGATSAPEFYHVRSTILQDGSRSQPEATFL